MPAGAEAPEPPGERVRPPGAVAADGDPWCAPCAGLSWRTRLPATSSPSSVSTSPSPLWSCSTASGVTGTGAGARRGQRGCSAEEAARPARPVPRLLSAGPGLLARRPEGPFGRALGAAGQLPPTGTALVGSDRRRHPLCRVPATRGRRLGAWRRNAVWNCFYARCFAEEEAWPWPDLRDSRTVAATCHRDPLLGSVAL